MKKIILFFFFLLLINLVLAENIYQSDSLDLNLKVKGKFELVKENANARVSETTAQLLLYPKNDYRQEQKEFTTEGTVNNNQVEFVWKDQQLGTKEYSYNTVIKTKNEFIKVKSKIPFPLPDVETEKKYILPTETIDSDNPEIIAKAAELAQGEDDAFQVAFKIASWVEENTVYDLNSLTSSTSQKASWVLKNHQGVCDEMTSLFIAMVRSLGMPARFVSGVSYTNSELFSYNWQPHGWAEVYFPHVGWVSFDATFGEYGYIDVTHIKLREGFDPQEPATKFEWVSEGVGLNTGKLDFKVQVQKQGQEVPEEIQLEQEVLSSQIGFGSYDLIKGILKNTADYYTAATLKLSVPKEIEIVGKNKRTILLSPKEVRETYWMIHVPGNLNSDYQYIFPTVIYSEKNVSVEDRLEVRKEFNSYTQEEIEKLTVQNEEKSYSRKISFNCNYPQQLKLNQEATFSCTIKNSGNTNLNQINFCLSKVCELIDLPINQEKTTQIRVKGGQIGWNKIMVSAENDLIEKKTVLEYSVLDEPKIEVNITTSPQPIKYGENYQIYLDLSKKSFSPPQNIVLTVSGPGFENLWEIENITSTNNQKLSLELGKEAFSFKNKFAVTLAWRDQEGKTYSETQEIIVWGEANSFIQKIIMLFNKIFSLFN